MKGQIIVTYQDGVMKSVLFENYVNLFPEQAEYLFKRLTACYQETEIGNNGMGLLVVEPVSESKSNEKIALFCSFYKRHIKASPGHTELVEGQGLKYKVSAADSGKIKQVDVTEELLTVYFSSTNFLFRNRWSISNYVKYFNELRAEALGQKQDAASFPNHWTKEYQAKLPTEKWSAYWQHLRSLGKHAVHDSRGQLVDFK